MKKTVKTGYLRRTYFGTRVDIYNSCYRFLRSLCYKQLKHYWPELTAKRLPSGKYVAVEFIATADSFTIKFKPKEKPDE